MRKVKKGWQFISYTVFVWVLLCHAAANAAPVEWKIIDGGNGHYYERAWEDGYFVWSDAIVAASNRTHNNWAGYLVTVTSQAEHDFLHSIGAADGWIGLSDIANEGIFVWETGPEAGSVATYTNWFNLTGEPNGSNSENCAHMAFSNGEWNDWNCNGTDIYVVEFSAPVNSPPVADAGGPYVVATNSTITFDSSGSTDPDGDGLIDTWVVDGVPVPGNTYVAGNEAGIYDVELTVYDGTVLSEVDTTTVIVYDPTGGFVTGGGWIDSPEGAYEVDDELMGKATFAFVSKYKKGASIPTGQTQFKFNAGDLNFHSDSYQWLVVNQGGTNAQFKGEGTINGQLSPGGEAYKFMLWAKDDAPDTFRIKIWHEDGGDVLSYDNGFDQAIGGGSIVVHSGKKK